MTAHIYSDLMKLYYEDALETTTPWERWEWRRGAHAPWVTCYESPNWRTEHEYRRKRIPLCQVEGRDVFTGDKLWHKTAKRWITASGPNPLVGLIKCEEYGGVDFSLLTWTEPQKTKTVYQWAWEVRPGDWCTSDYFYESEDKLREKGVRDPAIRVIRLDYTALEVPV